MILNIIFNVALNEKCSERRIKPTVSSLFEGLCENLYCDSSCMQVMKTFVHHFVLDKKYEMDWEVIIVIVNSTSTPDSSLSASMQ